MDRSNLMESFSLGVDKKIVLDITSVRVRGMLVHRKKNSVEVKGMFEEKCSEKYYRGSELANVEGLISEVVNYCKQLDSKVKKVDVVLDSDQMYAKVVTLTGVNESEVPKLMEDEYTRQFGDLKKNGTTFDYESLGSFEVDGVEGKKYIIGAFSDEIGERILNEFKNHGYKLNAIDTEISALKNALNAVGSEKNVKAGVHVGEIGSVLYVIAYGKLVFVRRFTMSVGYLTRSIQKKLGVGIKVVEDVLSEIGFTDKPVEDEEGPDGVRAGIEIETYQNSLRDELNEFTTELFRSFEYVESNLKVGIDDVYVTGEMNRMAGFRQGVADQLGLEVNKFEFNEETDSQVFDIVNSSEELIKDDYMRAFGLGLRGVRY